jgi:membrane associated rhomboid family serine protease
MLTELVQFIKINFRRSNNALIQLILIHVIVFCLLIISKAICVLLGYEIYYQHIYQYLILPASWETFLQQPWSVFTYFWIHEQFFSVVWNSFFLYSFGHLIVTIWHSKTLKYIYILGGVGAGAFFLLLYNLAPGLRDYMGWLIGPAGSLYAVMVAAALALPDLYFNLLFIGRVKIKYIAAGLLLLACFELTSHQSVAIAHLGGAMIGYIFVQYIRNFKQLCLLLSYFPNIIRRKKKFKITYRQPSKAVSVKVIKTADQELAEIDTIIDKIAASGYESLTEKEKRQLFRAGK